MKTKMLLPALTTALALSAGATPAAWALQTEWVATGTVYNSYDYTGVFGLAGSSLDGDRFTADFYIDTSKGTEDRVPGFADEVYGGTEFGNLTPVSATLTINGVTESFSGSDYGAAYIDSPAEVFCDVDSNNYENELFAELEPGTGGVASVIGQPSR